MALGSFPPLHSHITASDIQFITHITNFTFHNRPRFVDGFYLSIQLDESFQNAVLTRSFALQDKTQPHLPSKQELHNIKSEIVRAALLQQSKNTTPKLIEIGLISFPSSSLLNQSGDIEQQKRIRTEIEKSPFFSYFIHTMDLNTAESVLKQFLPNVVRYYSMALTEDQLQQIPS